MSDNAVTGRPGHLWVVAILAIGWNGIAEEFLEVGLVASEQVDHALSAAGLVLLAELGVPRHVGVDDLDDHVALEAPLGRLVARAAG